MSQIYFAMIEGCAAFFDADIHGSNIPTDAVKVTAARHAQLVAGQAEGKTIAATAKGRPKLVDPITTAADRRAQLVAAVKREAARRINAVSPIWRQLNDLRAGADAGGERFSQIDAIRHASELIEVSVADCPDGAVGEFPVRDNPLWPEQ